MFCSYLLYWSPNTIKEQYVVVVRFLFFDSIDTFFDREVLSPLREESLMLKNNVNMWIVLFECIKSLIHSLSSLINLWVIDSRHDDSYFLILCLFKDIGQKVCAIKIFWSFSLFSKQSLSDLIEYLHSYPVDTDDIRVLESCFVITLYFILINLKLHCLCKIEKINDAISFSFINGLYMISYLCFATTKQR